MKRTLFLYPIVLLSSCSTDTKDNNNKPDINLEVINKAEADSMENEEEDIPTYRYDTLLKSGYKLRFKFNDSAQLLILMHKDSLIRELSSVERSELPKTLGYKAADFDNYFAFVKSFGSGNPHVLQIIKKETGEVIRNGAWIDANEKKGYILYSPKPIPQPGDSMVLINMNSMVEKKYEFPSDIFDGPEVLNRIKLKNVDSDGLSLEYFLESKPQNLIVKRYNY